jgi:hypothetical protein
MKVAFSTGPIENVGASPAPAVRAFVKVLNRTGSPLTGVARSFRCDGTRQLIQERSFTVPANSCQSVVLSLVFRGALVPEFEIEIVPNQPGGLFAVFPKTITNVIIASQRVLHSELTEI